MKRELKLRILPDKVKGDFIVQLYLNDVLKWTVLTVKRTEQEAINFVNRLTS